MKMNKLLSVILAVIMLLTACAKADPADQDLEPSVEPTQQTQPTDPQPTETEPTDPQPTEPQPTEPAPTEPEPTDPTEPEVEFNPGEEDHVHRFGSWITEEKATCTRLGRKSRRCDCGEIEKKSYIEEHKYSQWEVQKEPTCTDHGENVRHCTTCGVEDKTINPKLGHDEQITPGTPATCTTSGMTDHIVCLRCGEVVQEATMIEAGHTLVIVEAVAPSCGVEGRTRGSSCSVCLEVFEESQVIPALSHSIETVFGQDATCGEHGWSEMDVCEHCGQVMGMAEVYDRLGHDLVEGVCTRCGHSCDHGVDPQNPGKPGSAEKAEGDPEPIEGTDKLCQKVVCQDCGEISFIVVQESAEEN